MNNTTLINKLNKIRLADNYIYELDSLILELKNEVMTTDTYKDKNKKQRAKKALSFLKALNKKWRPVLAYTDIQNDFQVFTDSYIAFYLKDHLELPKVPDDMNYPNVSCFIDKLNTDNKIELDFNYYLNGLKTKQFLPENKAYFKDGNKNINICFDVKLFKNVIDILGTTDLQVYYNGDFKPLLFINENNGDKAILLPCRQY
jgi:hypothetical protein